MISVEKIRTLQLAPCTSHSGTRTKRAALKTILLPALALFCAIASLCAAEPSMAFDRANQLYEEGKYREAAAAYHELVASGARSSALFFNLGNAQFKAGQTGQAIAAYRQAERLAPRDPDIRANLQFARQRVTGPTLQPSWLTRQFGVLTTNEWTLLAVVPVWGWFGLMITTRLRPPLKDSLRRTSFWVGVAALLGCATLAFALRQQFSGRTVVVTARDTIVRYGPFTESQSAFTAADGAELRWLDTKDDWCQVSDGGQRTGWLKTNAVAVLP
jgi:tetratricopeptide (TPR) repeat protein